MGVARNLDAGNHPGRPCAGSWRSVPLAELGAELRRAWERLVQTRGIPVLGSPAWWIAFGAAFAEPERPIQLDVLIDGEEARAILPLVPRGRGRCLASPENAHNPYWTFPIDADDPDVGGEVVSHLLESADCVVLAGLHEEGELLRSMRQALLRARVPFEVRPHEKGDVRIVLAGSFDDLFSRLHRNLQRDARQGRRRLEGMGTLRFDVATGREAAGPVLDACIELEARGWKGVSGAPIGADPHTFQFYRGLAREAAEAGTLALYTLRLDDRLVAFEYCLRGGGRIDLLKISYDPEWARCSPGTVLRAMVLEHELERGEMRSYHLGRPSDWKLRWSSDVRPLVTLRFYSGRAGGRIAWFRESLLGGGLRRIRGLRRAARWLRGAARSGGAGE